MILLFVPGGHGRKELNIAWGVPCTSVLSCAQFAMWLCEAAMVPAKIAE